MAAKKVKIETRIQEIKQELQAMGDMRPGSLSRQRRQRGGRYLQLSYVYRGKGHTEYVPPEAEELIAAQLVTYKRFKALTQEWAGLAIELSRIKVQEQLLGRGDGRR
jgi:hypothetical protein